jgi:ABC-type multidrug transport system ATPase subunit
MQTTLNNVGKRFNREWIFRRFTYQFQSGKKYAITGPNGSGKSTLLQVIAGSLIHNEGTIAISNGQQVMGKEQQAIGNGQQAIGKEQQAIGNRQQAMGKEQQAIGNRQQAIGNRQQARQVIANENFYQQISIAAPYLELIEEMTAKEMLHFHAKFKPLIPSGAEGNIFSIEEMLQTVGLQNAINKQIRYYSSGMKQRLKLAQAFFSNTPILLLDEPTTNLDTDGIALYHQLINNYTANKLVIVSSNDKQEYDFCGEVIGIGDYK